MNHRHQESDDRPAGMSGGGTHDACQESERCALQTKVHQEVDDPKARREQDAKRRDEGDAGQQNPNSHSNLSMTIARQPTSITCPKCPEVMPVKL
jgi:hypothetical protein